MPGVRGVHDVILHKYGDVKLVSFHIEVDAARSALDAHDLAERVEEVVEKAHGLQGDRACGSGGPRASGLRAGARMAGATHGTRPRLVGFHDLRVSGKRQAFDVSVDIVVSVDLPEPTHGEIAEAGGMDWKRE